MRTQLAIALLLLTTAQCKRTPQAPAQAQKPQPAAAAAAAAAATAPEKKSPQPPAALEALCKRCHLFPAPTILPRELWKAEIMKMIKILGSQGEPMDGVSPMMAASWYEAHAPTSLALYAGPAGTNPAPVTFSRSSYHPSAQEELGSIANVRFVQLFDDKVPGVVASDMRNGRILYFRPDRPQEGFQELARLDNPCHSEVVDLNGDGHRDLLIADLGNFLPNDEPVGRVVWLRGDGAGRFTPETILADVGRVADARAADFDLDGDLDVVVAAYGWLKRGRLMLLEQQPGPDGQPRFIRKTIIQRTGAIHTPIVDLNGDGRPDFVTLFAQEHETVVAYINIGPLSFRPEVLDVAPHPAWGSSGLQMVDLDGDGDLDALITNGDTMDIPVGGGAQGRSPGRFLMPFHGVRWLENRGTYPFVPHQLSRLYGATRAQAADMDGDGDQDIVAVAFVPDAPYQSVRVRYRLESVILLRQDSPGQFSHHTLSMLDTEIPSLDLADWDGDGDMDMVTGHLFFDRLRPRQADASITLWENRSR